MRLFAFLIVLSIALCAWVASAAWEAKRRETAAAIPPVAAIHADYPVCTTVHPPALRPPRRLDLRQHNSELS